MLSGEETYMKMEISGGNKYFVTLSEETLAVTYQNSRVYILNLEVLLLGICPTDNSHTGTERCIIKVVYFFYCLVAHD